MKRYLSSLRHLTRRAIFTETAPQDILRSQGIPKPLRPQARRLEGVLISCRLRHHYVTAQTCIFMTLLLWLIPLTLPQTNPAVDMSALRLCLYVMALATTIGGLLQAGAMRQTAVRIEVI